MSADPTPTTVGIIDAKIKLDASDFMAKIQEVKAAVGSLDSERATVTIDVDTARALAQIEEVRAAAAALGTGSIGGHTGGSGAGGSAAGTAVDAAATDALSAAERRERDAAAEAAASEEAASGARRRAAVSAVEEAAATDRADGANRRFGSGLNNMGLRTALIATAIGALVVAIGPLTGMAVGAAGALGMMGAAGVLAFLGIKDAIAQGNAQGVIFSGLLSTLTGDMQRLEATSASGVMRSFQQAVALIDQSMPMLNTSMGVFGQVLGGTVVAAVGATLNIIRQLNPLFLITALGVEHVAQAFRGWTAGPELQQFGDYAISVLPQVGKLLGDVVRAAVDLGASFAPLGSILIGTVDALVNVLDALARMGPSMSVIVGGALAVYGAFATWRAISPIILSVAGATDTLKASLATLSLPITVAVGALAILAMTGQAIEHSYNTSAQGVSTYTNALMNSNGATANAIARATALQVQQQGLAGSLKIAGVSEATFNNAIVKGGATLDQMVAHMRAANEGQRTYAVGAGAMVNAQNRVELSARNLHAGLVQGVAAYNSYAHSVGAATIADAAQFQAKVRLASSLHTDVATLTAAEGAQRQQAAAAAAAKLQMVLEANAAGLLKLALDGLNGAAITNAQAQAAWASGLDSLKGSFNQNSTAITGNSRAALENRGAVAAVVAVGQTALEQTAQTTHSVSATTAAYKSMRSELINQISAITGNRTAAAALVDQLFKIPKNIKTNFQGNDADAKAKAAEAKKIAEDFARGDYKAVLKANPTPAQAATAQAGVKAMAFATKQYLATLKANPTPANVSSDNAARRAHGFAAGFYQATIRANNGPAMSAIEQTRSALAAINGTTATVYVSAVSAGVSYAQAAAINRNARQFRAQGGTIGAAQGITAGFFGTVRGPGSAFDDMAGMYALASGEEVISNIRGQADAWRPLLKAINAGRVSMSTFAELGLHAPAQRRREASQPTRQVNLGGIHIHNPVTQDPVTAAQHASQSILAYVNYP